jgi:hypothetical protein
VQRVVVPDPSAFRVSTPVLSEAATAAADATARPLPLPVAHDLFTSRDGQPLYCGFQVFGATKDPATGRFDVVSRFVLKNREGRSLAAPPPSPMALSPTGQLERVLVLPLAKLPGGEYELALTVEDHVAGKEETLVQTFSVEAPPVAARAGPPPPPSAQAPVAPVPPKLVPILALAGRYVVGYGSAFSKVVAQEDYRQDYPEPHRPLMRYSHADLVFVTLPGPIPWATFRDVYEVDGNKVHDRNARLEKLFVQSATRDAADQANAILVESSRFNLGPIQRTVNIPTLALLFLHPDNQGRFAFEDKGRGKVAGVDAVQIGFTERARPTVVGSTPSGSVVRGDVPATGRVWIEPETGAVLRTEVAYDFALEEGQQKRRVHAHVLTEYRRDKVLEILVPSEMHEAYELPLDVARGGNIFKDDRDEPASVSLTAVAIYSGYRRFEVTTDETYRPTDKQ